jgi:DNA-binding CsgD family transcriptional regulator
VREPSSQLVQAVRQSSLPTLLMRVPSEEILVASKEAGALLGLGADDLVGRNVEDFADDPPSGALPLVVCGRLSGFQARRRMRGADGESQEMLAWVRAADPIVPVEFAVVVWWPGGRSAWNYLPAAPADLDAGPDVVGTVNSLMEIERVSGEVHRLGLTAEEAVGGSVFRLFDVTSAADVLHALAEATERQQMVAIAVNVQCDGKPGMADLMVQPLWPAPSFSFSMACAGKGEVQRSPGDETILRRMGRGMHALAFADAFTFLHEAGIPGVDKLSPRELDITARLLSGDRVPAIAGAIYLSQSTVRNHLSRVFQKLGVGSQQELIEMFRETTDRPAEDDTSST